MYYIRTYNYLYNHYLWCSYYHYKSIDNFEFLGSTLRNHFPSAVTQTIFTLITLAGLNFLAKSLLCACMRAMLYIFKIVSAVLIKSMQCDFYALHVPPVYTHETLIYIICELSMVQILYIPYSMAGYFRIVGIFVYIYILFKSIACENYNYTVAIIYSTSLYNYILSCTNIKIKLYIYEYLKSKCIHLHQRKLYLLYGIVKIIQYIHAVHAVHGTSTLVGFLAHWKLLHCSIKQEQVDKGGCSEHTH